MQYGKLWCMSVCTILRINNAIADVIRRSLNLSRSKTCDMLMERTVNGPLWKWAFDYFHLKFEREATDV